MAKVSVLIAARNEEYLHQTVEDVLAKASGDIEVLVMLDGWKPEVPLKEHKNLIQIHNPVSKGMRWALNNLGRQARGKYLLKLDAHCMIGEGFDEILQRDCQPDWLVTPSRHRLDAGKWLRGEETLDYQYITFPYTHDDLYGVGFHGKKWIGADGVGTDMGKRQYYFMENSRKDIKIDDIMVIQGSGWFMERDMFYRIDMLDERHSYFYQEGNELCFKVWLIGGRCVVNKNTWYAHFHKVKPTQYGFSLSQKKETQRFQAWAWMNDKWPKAIRTMEWFVDEKFAPMPAWPKDWKSFITEEKDFRIMDKFGHDGFKINGID